MSRVGTVMKSTPDTFMWWSLRAGHQGDEAHAAGVVAAQVAGAVPGDEDEPLADRDHETAPGGELLEQRGRDALARGRGDVDRVVRGSVGVAAGAVADEQADTLDARVHQVQGRLG